MIKKLYHRIINRQKDGILKHSTVYFSFFAVITIMNILIRKYLSTRLSIDDYGVFTSLLAFFTMIIAPFSFMPLYLSKKMSHFNEKKDTKSSYMFFKYNLKYIAVILAMVAGLIIFLSPLIMERYHLSNITPILIIAFLFFATLISGSFMAGLQSFQVFWRIGSVNVSMVVIKGISSIILIGALGLTYNGAILSLLAGALVGMLISFILLNRIMREKIKPSNSHEEMEMSFQEVFSGDFFKEISSVFMLLLFLGIIKSIDEYFARHFLTSHDNGLYGALSYIGKSSIFLVSTVVYVIFPKLASKIAEPKVTRRIMLKGLFLTLITSLGVLSAIIVVPGLIIRVMQNTKYMQILPMLKWLFIAYIPYSMIMIFINFFIIHRNRIFIIGLMILTGIQLLMFQLYHGSINQIVLVLGIMGYIILAFCFIVWYFVQKKMMRKLKN